MVQVRKSVAECINEFIVFIIHLQDNQDITYYAHITNRRPPFIQTVLTLAIRYQNLDKFSEIVWDFSSRDEGSSTTLGETEGRHQATQSGPTSSGATLLFMWLEKPPKSKVHEGKCLKS
eukprot:GHVT01001110.1.p1 GENE.GHVT01001110.1~~GHVT01001110.1.p1  ORF type:complete len:119 (-),score=4.28 GHVT01001110.1:280-636(-)